MMTPKTTTNTTTNVITKCRQRLGQLHAERAMAAGNPALSAVDRRAYLRRLDLSIKLNQMLIRQAVMKRPATTKAPARLVTCHFDDEADALAFAGLVRAGGGRVAGWYRTNFNGAAVNFWTNA